MKTSELHACGLIVIVGAGPAGLTLGRLLQMRGFNVTIFERDSSPTARNQGGSLDLRPDSGQHAIRAAGLEEDFKSKSRSDASVFKLIDSQSNEIPIGGDQTHEDAGPEIDRGELRLLLLNSLVPNTVHWGRTVQNVSQQIDKRWRLNLSNGESVVADLVVGAEGIGSSVRSQLTSIQPRYIGHMMLAANIRQDFWRNSKISDLLGEGSMMFAGGQKTILVQRCARDLILLYFSMKVGKKWPSSDGFELAETEAVLSTIREAYSDWSPQLLSMLTEIEGTFHKWPLSVMPPDLRWETRPGLTMLGDAAHVMPPFTGKGVNLALLDALELAQVLTCDDDIETTEAIRNFEARMQKRMQKEIEACLAVGKTFYGITVNFAEPAVA